MQRIQRLRTIALGLSLLAFHTIAQAIIIDSNTLTIITEHAQPGDLVVFDLDNTLLQTTDNFDIGSDQWTEKRIIQEHKSGLSIDEALEVVLQELEYIFPHMDVEVIEDTTSDLIAKLQKNDITVMGLTARSVQFAPCTQKQLHNINIYLDNPNNILLTGTHTFNTKIPAQYYHGVLHVGNNNKGKILGKFLELVNHKPNRIIFVDDKLKNVKKVEAFAQKSNIEFIGIRFGALDKKIAAYRNKYFILHKTA